MFGPPTIELRGLFLGERKFFLTFLVGQAFPESHRKFRPIAGWKPQELRKRAGFHVVILSPDVSCRNWIDRYGHWVATQPLKMSIFVRLVVQRSNMALEPSAR